MVSKKIKFLLFAVLTTALVSASLVYYAASSSTKAHYLTETVTRHTIEKKIIATGSIAALQLVTVGSQASGQVKKIYVLLGDKVHKGQLIAEIDATKQINDLNTAYALLKSYEAQLEARKVSMEIARTQYARECILRKKDANSQESFENAENTWKKAKADVAETESLILQAQIAVDTAKANISYTRITAPINGEVVSISVEEGQTINASQATPTIIQIADLSFMNVKIQISEADVTMIHPGMQINCSILSAPKFEYKTTLSTIDPADTLTTDNTKNNDKNNMQKNDNAIYYYGRAVIKNTDNKLRIGMTMKNSITIDTRKNVICIPSNAIYERNNKKYVKVLQGDGTKEKEITIGISDESNTEIITGLNDGETIITSEITNNEIDAYIEKEMNQ